jgi:hypothetical protein
VAQPGERVKRLWALVPACGLAAAGCSSPALDQVPNPPFSVSASAVPDRSLPPPSAHWARLRSTCPDLTSGAARTLGVAGAGRPTGNDAENPPNATVVDCAWGSTDGRGVSVTLRMLIQQRQAAADAQWQVLSAGSTDRIAVGDEGFIGTDGAAVRVIVRSGNVVATVRIVPPDASASPDRLAGLRQPAAEIVNDVLDDLVPA